MAYVAVVKALYEYQPQDPETELALKEDQICYVIEKEDDDWWKAKLKDAADDGAVGLIPATYVEEIPPVSTTRALYAYDSTSPEELSMAEDDVLEVFSIEEDWLLVRHPSAPALGFVPRAYCDELDESAGVAVIGQEEAEEDVEAYHREEEEAEHKRQLAEQQRLLKLKDQVETWSISEVDGKKKKKGTLGVGNGAVFFASDNDKMEGVNQYNITELAQVSQTSSKEISLAFSTLSQPLVFNCGSSDTTQAILAKLHSSKEAAGEVLQLIESEQQASEDEEAEVAPVAAVAEPKSVRWASDTPPAQAPAAAGSATATVLYDFDAQGEDELTVQENEIVTVVEQENDEWWTVRNSAGHEGVVPAQYVQLNDGAAPAPTAAAAVVDDHEDEHAREAEAAAAAAALDAERQRDAAKKAEERRAIERAARERAQQEEEDRAYAEQVEQKEIARAERRARRQQEEQRSQREIESARRREQARGQEPPKVAWRPSVQDVNEAARNLPSRGRQTPVKPPENSRPKPTPGRTRVWSDKSGQFKVEAEYLGLNGNKVRLHKLNGIIIDVPLEKMSTEDVQLIRRHEARKARAAIEEDNTPLARTREQQPQQQQRQRSGESIVRAAEFEEPPKEALQPQKPRKPRVDWFAFFLDAGCDMDDCTRYAAAFERDRIDHELLPDLESSTLRSLGLKEGDVIRVRKVITSRYAKKTPEQEAQIKQDEDYARQLQEYEQGGSKGPVPQPPPSLFTGPDGKLANNTRRGRPERKMTGPETVDPSALAAVSEQLTGVSVTSPSPPPAPKAPTPTPPAAQEKKLLSGFDDDAWTIKPSASKPASPVPPPPAAPAPAAPSPAPANTTEQLLAQIQSMRPASTGASTASPVPKDTGSFDKYAAMVGQPTGAQQQPPAGAPIQPAPTGYGLGVQGSTQSMAQLANAPRGPLAPVPTNEGLLNPLQPAQTGFVPTRSNGLSPHQTGYPAQQQPPMMMQPTGYAAGFQSTYAGQPQQIQPNFTGYPGNFAQQSQTSSFNSIANIGPPQQQSNPDKFAPSNIFSAMKRSDFGKPEDQQPQSSNKYDALRPLTTGYNGAPGMGGMAPQQTGMGMMPQQTGYGGMPQQQMPMMGQPTGFYGAGGMMPNMTGFNPQTGQFGGQQYGYR